MKRSNEDSNRSLFWAAVVGIILELWLVNRGLASGSFDIPWSNNDISKESSPSLFLAVLVIHIGGLAFCLFMCVRAVLRRKTN